MDPYEILARDNLLQANFFKGVREAFLDALVDPDLMPAPIRAHLEHLTFLGKDTGEPQGASVVGAFADLAAFVALEVKRKAEGCKVSLKEVFDADAEGKPLSPEYLAQLKDDLLESSGT